MDQKLQSKLFESFPKLYSEHAKQGSIMSSGLAVNDGWFQLLWKLSEDLVKLDPELVACQVKEKFGTLSFYVRQAELGAKQYDSGMLSFEPQARNEQVRARIVKASEESAVTCEQCGKPGKLRRGSYYVVRCDDCMAAVNAELRKEFGQKWTQQHNKLLCEMELLGEAGLKIRGSYDRALETLNAGDCTEEDFAAHVSYLLKECRKVK